MSTTIKNVALAGAAGSLGSVVLEHLIASNKFAITILRRHGSQSTYPSSLKVVDVNFTSLQDLTAALQGQDAVVSLFGTPGFGLQPLLIDAAAAAGVKRFIPSEFGSNLHNPKTRVLPVYGQKVKAQDHLVETAAKHPGLTWTVVYNGAFLDWGLKRDFIFKISDHSARLYDGGNTIFSATTLASIGDAVVGVLTHPQETANRPVYVEDAKVSQKQLLAAAKKAAPEQSWKVEEVKLDDLTKRSDERLAQGIFDAETFLPYVFRAVFDPAYGGNFEKTDNELFGIKGKSEAEVEEIVKDVVGQL